MVLPPLPPLERLSWQREIGPAFMNAWGRPNGRIEAEHVAILGPTGSGKSTLEAELLTLRKDMRGTHEVVIATKPADNTLMKLGYPIITRWDQMRYGQDQVILWPRSSDPERQAEFQRPIIKEALAKMWVANSNRLVCFDEVAYIETELNLKRTMMTYYREARALGISMLATTQRPRFVNRYLFSEASWLAIFDFYDLDDAKRVAEILGDTRYLTQIRSLRRHEFILLRRATRQAVITRLGS